MIFGKMVMLMNLTNEETKTLLAILKTEIVEVEDLIKNADVADKAELEKHLVIVKSISKKI